MSNHKLFEHLSDTKSPESLLCPFNNQGLVKVDTTSSYFDETLYRKAELTRNINYLFIIERAICRLLMPSINTSLSGFGGFGFDGDGNYYADYYDGTSSTFNEDVSKGITDFSYARHIVFKIEAGTQKMTASEINEYGTEVPYLIKTQDFSNRQKNRHSASAAIFALSGYIIASVEHLKDSSVASNIIYKHYKDIAKAWDLSDIPSFLNAIRALDVDIYTYFQYPEIVQQKVGVQCLNPSNYDRLDYDPVQVSSIKPLVYSVGNSKFFEGSKVSAVNSVSIKGKKRDKCIWDYTSSNSFDLGATLTSDEEALIPKGFERFIPSSITLDVAREIKESSSDPVPARNFLWTGETGTGKTTESQMLAVLLHLPYRSMNLSSDKLSSDILVSCLPNSNKVSKDELDRLMNGFPDAETVAVNPERAFKLITGEDRQGATEEDVNKAKSKAVLSLMNKAADFMYVDSPFVESFRRGGVIELQEVNSCKAAILKSLNEALDDLNIIHLPTGEVVHRSPSCIVVVTANVGQGYEGINNFSNDFIARFHQADVFELPDEEVLINRVMERSGYDDKKVINKMIKVMKAIQRVLLETKGDYGSCSPRGLIAWARKTKHSGDPYEAGLKTIVGLSTQDPEIRVELIHALETEFAPKVI